MSWEFSVLFTRNLESSNNAVALVEQVEHEFWARQMGHSFQASTAHMDFSRCCGGSQYVGKQGSLQSVPFKREKNMMPSVVAQQRSLMLNCFAFFHHSFDSFKPGRFPHLGMLFHINHLGKR